MFKNQGIFCNAFSQKGVIEWLVRNHMEISFRFSKNHNMLNVLTMPKVWSIILVKDNPVENEKIFANIFVYIKESKLFDMKNIKKSITTLIIIAITLTLVMPMTAQAATSKLSKTKITVSVKESYQLKVKGTSKKVTWKSSNKKIAAISKNGKVNGKKKGSAVITAKVNGRTLKCKIVVKDTHKHHWAAYDDPQPENIFGVVCYCGKVFSSVEEWELHAFEYDDILIDATLNGRPAPDWAVHNGFSGVKTVYKSWIWYYYCDICGYKDWDDDYSHPVEAVICSGCKKEFKNYEEWKKHFLENSWNGDESHRKCTVRIRQ